jgi:hypothetical protein
MKKNYFKKMGNYANPNTGTDDKFFKGQDAQYTNTDPGFTINPKLTDNQQNSLDIMSNGFYRGTPRTNQISMLQDPSAVVAGKIPQRQKTAMEKMSEISGATSVGKMYNSAFAKKGDRIIVGKDYKRGSYIEEGALENIIREKTGDYPKDSVQDYSKVKGFGKNKYVKPLRKEGDLGMQSVKYGIDNNPEITAADPKAKFIAKNKK